MDEDTKVVGGVAALGCLWMGVVLLFYVAVIAAIAYAVVWVFNSI